MEQEQEQEQIDKRWYTYGMAVVVMAILITAAFILGGFIVPTPYAMDDVGYPAVMERTME